MVSLLLALAFPAHAQLTSPTLWSRNAKRVQHVQTATNSVYSFTSALQTSAFPTALTPGNLLVCVSQVTNGSVTNMTDTSGDTFTKQMATSYSTAQVEMWYAVTSGGANARVTATYSGLTSFARLTCLELSGNHRTLPVFASNVSRSSLASLSTSVSLPQRSVSVLGYLVSDASTVTAGSGYTTIYTSGDGDLAELRTFDTNGGYTATALQSPPADALLLTLTIRGR